MEQLGDRLAVLGGADLDVLSHAKSERGTFIGMGLVILGTASVAALSMTFALRNAVLLVIDPRTGGPAATQPISHLVLSVVLGMVWGALILVLDRALIRTMQGVVGARALWYALPRFVLAVIIGVVVSTPMTLQVFSTEIAGQVKLDQDKAINEMQRAASDSPVAQRLKSVEESITAQENIQKGQVPGLSSPELEQAQQKLTEAETRKQEAQKQRDNAYLNMICEEEGAGAVDDCRGRSSQRRGKGPRFIKRQDEYNTAEKELAKAKDDVTSLTQARNEAQTDANNKNQDKVAKAGAQASIKLCGRAVDAEGKEVNPPVADPNCKGGLRAEAESLRSTLGAMQNGDLIRQQSGLVAQIVALGKISTKDQAAGIAHLFVALLFIVIELLPVIIKTFIAVRGVTQYDRIARKLQDDEFEEVTTGTEERQRQRERETKKSEAIRDDMLDREIALGKTANEHVANEMEIILGNALTEWSRKVQEELSLNSAEVGMNQPASTSATDPYGLPDGRQI